MNFPDLITNIYDVLQEIGRGSFSTVMLVTHKKTGTDYALKVITKSLLGEQIGAINKEIGIMQSISHPNICKLIDVIDSEEHLFIVMELVTGGELLNEIINRGEFTEKDASTIIFQVCNALEYLHHLGIVHRDIKPENILLREKGSLNIVISDFGLSEIVGNEIMLNVMCGTPSYVAPEILKQIKYGKQVDLWSTGVVLFTLLCGSQPFYSDTIEGLLEIVIAGKYEFEEEDGWDQVSDEAKDIINKLLVLDPNERYSCKQVLEHEWIKNATDKSLDVVESIKRWKTKRKFQTAIMNTINPNLKTLTNILQQQKARNSIDD